MRSIASKMFSMLDISWQKFFVLHVECCVNPDTQYTDSGSQEAKASLRFCAATHTSQDCLFVRPGPAIDGKYFCPELLQHCERLHFPNDAARAQLIGTADRP